jgi:hypothetical protein
MTIRYTFESIDDELLVLDALNDQIEEIKRERINGYAITCGELKITKLERLMDKIEGKA